MSGVATLYGRFATSFVGVLRQVEPERVAEDDVDVRRDVAQQRLEVVVDLDRVNMADALSEVSRENSLARADLEDDVVRPSSARRSITPRMFGSARKCWPNCFFAGLTVRSMQSRSRRSGARARPDPPRAPAREPRVCGRRTPARSAGRAPAAARDTARLSRQGSGRRGPASRRGGGRPPSGSSRCRRTRRTSRARGRSAGVRRREAVEHDRAAMAGERRERVLVSGARVDYDRLSELLRELELCAKRRCCASRGA